MVSFFAKYQVNSVCENCGKETLLFIPKGMFVYDFIKTKKSVCSHCGCRIQEVTNEEINPVELEDKHRDELKRLRDKVKQRNG